MYYNISDEIRDEIREVLTNNNISNDEKKSIIVDIFAKLFGSEPTPAMPDNMSDDAIQFDPEYAAGYNLGKWFASETYKNYGHEPNTENMIDLPKRERMKILESVSTKLPKDQRLMNIIGDILTPEEKIKLIIDLFMEPDENQKPGQGQGQSQGQPQQNQQNNDDSGDEQDDQNQQNQQNNGGSGDEQDNQNQQNQQNQQSGGASDSESGDDNDSDASDNQQGGASGEQKDDNNQEQNQQSGGGSGDEQDDQNQQNQQNQQSGGGSSKQGDDKNNQSDQSSGSSSSSEQDGGDDDQSGASDEYGDEEGSDESGDDSGKSAQEELDDLLNTDKDSEANSANNDFDFGDDVMGNDHVISEEDGNKIRNSENATVAETDKNFAKEGETSIDLIDDLYDQIKAKLTAEEREFVDKVNNDLKQKVQRAKKGIINWKKVLRKFMNSQADVYEKGSLRKNLYTMTGIGLHHPRATKQLNKCVVYIDTSGSVNNEQTQLVPLMLAEIGKIAKDCGFTSVDVNLFHHDVYTDVDDPIIISMTKNIKPSTTLRKDWGILANDGGTDIQKVYKSIEKNYTRNGKLNPGVATIIIITDVEGIMDSGTVSNYVKRFDKSVFKKMVYIIYDRYKDVHRGQLTTKVDSVLSPYSKHVEIGLADFKRQIKARFTNESINDMKRYKNKFLREASLADRRKAREEQKNIVQSGDTEKIADVLRKDAIAGGRILGAGANDKYFKYIKDVIANIFPDWQEVTEERSVKGGLYYITDDNNVYIGGDVTNANINKIIDLCTELLGVGSKIEGLYGNIILRNNMKFEGFPKNFPNTVYGDITLNMLPNMVSFDNAPTEGIQNAVINVNNKVIEKQNEYAMLLKSKGTRVKCASLLMNSKNESLIEAVNERKNLAQKYINESIPVIGGMLFKPTKGRFEQNLRKDNPNISDQEFETIFKNRAATSKHNKEIFDNVLVNFGLGSLTKDDITVISKRDDVKGALSVLVKNSGAEAYNRYVSLVDDIENKSADKAFKDSYIYKVIRDAKDTGVNVTEDGLRVFLDDDDNIIAVAIVSKKKLDNGKKLKYLYYGIGDSKNLYDEFMIQDALVKRSNIYKRRVVEPFNSFGFSNKNKPSSSDATIRRFLYQIVFVKIASLLKLELQANANFGSYSYVNNNDIFVEKYNDDGDALLKFIVKDGCSVNGTQIGYKHRRDFIDLNNRFPTLIFSKLNNSDVTHFDKYFEKNPDFGKIFTESFLRMVVSSLGLFSEDQLNTMSHNRLELIVNSVLDIPLNDTFFSSLRPIDKLVFEYTSFAPLAGAIKKIIEFHLPSSLMLSYNNNKIINRAGKHNKESEGVTVARRVFDEYMKSNPNKAYDVAQKVRAYHAEEFKDNGYDASTMSEDEIFNVYFDEILPNVMYITNENILYIDSIIKGESIREVLGGVYGDESVVDDIISGMEKDMHTLKAAYDIIYRKTKQVSDIQFIEEKLDQGVKILNKAISDWIDSLDSNVLSSSGNFSTNAAKRREVEKAIDKLTKDLSTSTEYVYNTITGRKGNFRDVILNNKADRYVKTKKVKRYSSAKMLDEIMDKINLVRANVLDKVSNIDVNNVDDPVFSTFVDYIDTYFDVMDNLVNVVASSKDSNYIRTVFDMLENLYNRMNTLIKATDEEKMIEICVDGDESIYSIFRRIFVLNKNIKTGKVKLNVV